MLWGVYMAEVLRVFEEPVSDVTGEYGARVVGRPAADGMWEGWLEFTPRGPNDTDVLATAVESRQPEREHLAYWASGLTPVYVEGALARARHPITVRTRIVEIPATDAPAPRVITHPHQLPSVPEPVLNPFEVATRSLDVLAQELTALGRARLLNIIEAYELNPARTEITWMTDAQLITFIVTAVEAQMKARR
jgi:hypothetical protein